MTLFKRQFLLGIVVSTFAPVSFATDATQATVTVNAAEYFRNQNQRDEPKGFKWSDCLGALSEAEIRQLDEAQAASTKATQELISLTGNKFDADKELRQSLRDIKRDFDSQRREMEQRLVRLDGEKKVAFNELINAQNGIKTQCEAEAQQFFQTELATIQTGVVTDRNISDAAQTVTDINGSFGEQLARCVANTPTIRLYEAADRSYQLALSNLQDEEELIHKQLADLRQDSIQDQALAENENKEAKAFIDYQEGIVKATEARAVANAKTIKRRQSTNASLSCLEDYSDKLKEIRSYTRSQEAAKEAKDAAKAATTGQ